MSRAINMLRNSENELRLAGNRVIGLLMRPWARYRFRNGNKKRWFVGQIYPRYAASRSLQPREPGPK
jgi:hypothetical protein